MPLTPPIPALDNCSRVVPLVPQPQVFESCDGTEQTEEAIYSEPIDMRILQLHTRSIV